MRTGVNFSDQQSSPAAFLPVRQQSAPVRGNGRTVDNRGAAYAERTCAQELCVEAFRIPRTSRRRPLRLTCKLVYIAHADYWAWTWK